MSVRQQQANLNLPVLGQAQANPIPAEYEVAHVPLPVWVNPTTIARINHLHALQDQKQHRQGDDATHL